MPLRQLTRPSVPRADRPTDQPDSGFVSEPRRGDHRIRRWALNGFLVLMLVVGLWHTFGLPLVQAASHPAPPAAAPAPIGSAAAARLATLYTADYFSYDSPNPDVRAAALARWTGQSQDSVPAWTGTGQLRTDLVTAGPQVVHGANETIVQTSARVIPAKLAGGAATPNGGAPVGGDRAADPGPAGGSWQATTPLWLSLDVVVVRSGGALHVAGAVFSGDAPVAIAGSSDQTDSALTASTDQLPHDLFTAVADGQLGYMTAPHVQLAGLSGAVKLAALDGWAVAQTGGGNRYATVNVTWQLAGDVGVQITQRYALRITNADGRWLLGSYGPRLED